ncbi:MAG: dicarboxylate/amino acid:cation symporter, partial [Synergistaceae bacterium]|nr:dicarboxylate/amino acid:cation symporter [Synergistaceae bacterium]
MSSNNSFTGSLPFKLVVALVAGILVGFGLTAIEGSTICTALLNIIVTIRYISGQFINFCVPLIIIGFIAPSITRLGSNASRMLILALILAYVSSIGAAFAATFAGYSILPFMNIVSEVEGLKSLPEVLFKLAIPQIMPVISALFLSITVGLAAAWNRSKYIINLLEEFQKVVLSIVTRFLIPVLPWLI